MSKKTRYPVEIYWLILYFAKYIIIYVKQFYRNDEIKCKY